MPKEGQMHKTAFLLAAVTSLLMISAAACSPAGEGPAQPASAPVNQTADTAPAPIAAATEPAVAAQPTSSSADQPAPDAGLAPLCQTANACEAPSSQQIQIGCVDKVPYTNVLVSPGTQYEVSDNSGTFSCVDSGSVVDGKTVLTCHGKELYTFDLKLSGSACGDGNLATGTGQCQEGYGYDSAQQCCAPIAADTSGSTTVQVNLGGCPLPRPGPGG
jgi:hypothetical protein